MADYIYTMETRFSPDHLKATNTVQEIARARGMNVYLTGGAIRDILSGFPIRDLDFTVQGDVLELKKDLEAAGGKVDMVDHDLKLLHVVLPGGVRAEINMARSETYDKPGAPPQIAPATITEDLRRRDFTINAIALSLNEGSRGLLLDPANGVADIEAHLIRILHNYAFLDDPSRLIRATRFGARFHWEMEERTKARYDAAREGEYIQYINKQAIGYELEQIAHEEDPLNILRALEREGWLKVLNPKWQVAKLESPELTHLLKTRAQMTDFAISVDAAPAVMHFLTHKFGEAEVAAVQKMIPHREFVAAWNHLEDEAKELAKKLQSKEAATNSGAWTVLANAKPEALLYLDVTTRNKAVEEKIKNYFGKWRQMQQKLPLVEMAELRITPQLPEYPQITHQAFLQLLDGKLRTHTEIINFLKPFEPPPPPPPPTPVRRGRGAAKKAAAAAAAPAPATAPAPQAVAEAPKPTPEKPKKAAQEKPTKAPAEEKKAGKAAPDQKKAAVSAKKVAPEAKKAEAAHPAKVEAPQKAAHAPVKASAAAKHPAKAAHATNGNGKHPAKSAAAKAHPAPVKAKSAAKPSKNGHKPEAKVVAKAAPKKVAKPAPAKKAVHKPAPKPAKKAAKRR